MAPPLRIAVVGAGISGLSAAYFLGRRYRVTLFEKERRLGGHAHTHRVAGDAGDLWMDSGFLVYNHRTYPHFVNLLAELGVEGRPSEMSFSVRCRRCRLEWASRSVDTVFAQRRRVLDPRHLLMLAEIPRFNRMARAFLAGDLPDETLAAFLDRGRFSPAFSAHFLLPLIGAVWSSSFGDALGFSVRSLLRFLENHGWLTLDPPEWWTVAGGSRRYVDAIARRIGDGLQAGRGVVRIRRQRDGVFLTTDDGDLMRFDRVVIATHADQALALLADPSPEERRLLGAFRYSRNRTLLHTDRDSLPVSPRAWAAWNMDLLDCRDTARPVGMTYHLNRLQSLPGPTQYCVTLNDPAPRDGRVLAEMDYTHPVLDATAVAAQPGLRRLSGERNTFYAGAHLRYGFHEDGLMSAIDVAAALGCRPAAAEPAGTANVPGGSGSRDAGTEKAA